MWEREKECRPRVLLLLLTSETMTDPRFALGPWQGVLGMCWRKFQPEGGVCTDVLGQEDIRLCMCEEERVWQWLRQRAWRWTPSSGCGNTQVPVTDAANTHDVTRCGRPSPRLLPSPRLHTHGARDAVLFVMVSSAPITELSTCWENSC